MVLALERVKSVDITAMTGCQRPKKRGKKLCILGSADVGKHNPSQGLRGANDSACCRVMVGMVDRRHLISLIGSRMPSTTPSMLAPQCSRT
jgi:hypothetical protein